MTNLEISFTSDLMRSLQEAEAVTGVSEVRLKKAAEETGGAQAVRQMLDRGQTTRQFLPLKQKGRLELSVEALVIRGKYAELFSDEQVNSCLSSLLEAGMF